MKKLRRPQISTVCNPIHHAGVFSGPAERRLLNDLMSYYQKLERPVANESEAIQLRFGLTLQQIMNVVSYHQQYHLIDSSPYALQG